MPTMNEDIKKYPIYILYAGQLQTAEWVQNTDSYDHYNWELHQLYSRMWNYQKNIRFNKGV